MVECLTFNGKVLVRIQVFPIRKGINKNFYHFTALLPKDPKDPKDHPSKKENNKGSLTKGKNNKKITALSNCKGNLIFPTTLRIPLRNKERMLGLKERIKKGKSDNG